ncbi:MAG: TonB-dependent receptor [Acidobacteriaceae bacterium]|nr:TonB-dependent receptor [Acidobacteriaceae bacterium]
MRSFAKLLLLFFAFGLFAPHKAFSQTDTATLSGTVVDSTGASIPGATVTVRQTSTNFSRTVTTSGDGGFRVEFLPIGSYAVHVSAPGFQTLERSGITLNAMQSASLDKVALAVGQEQQVVEVTSDLPLVNNTNSTLGRVIDNQEVDNLPLVGRNPYDLLPLTPGVQASRTVNNLGYPEQHTYINGSTDGTVGQVSYYLDGGINMTGLRNTGNILPNPDAIQEFSVQTNNFSAQFGRTSAGIVSAVTKSGTNKVHGSVFDFERNNAANASSWGTGQKALPLHRHQFGATVGGPVVKDKTFFFGSYAGLRQSQSAPLNSAIVPDTLQRAGNFSENLPTNSGTITSCTQTVSATDKALTDHGGRFIVCNPITRVPYAGNIITSTLDPTAQQVLSRNVPGPSNTNNGLISTYTTQNQSDEFLIKIDHNIGNHRISANYFQTNGMSTQLPSGGTVPGWSMQLFNWRQQNANLSDTWTINSSMVNQVWANYSRLIAGRTNIPQTTIAAYGSDFNVQGTPSLPQISVNGWFTLSQAIAGPLAGDNLYALRDVMAWNKGRHSIHLGAEGALEKDAQQTLLNNYGVFAFTSSTTSRTGNALSDFVLGRPNTMNQDSPVYANANYFNYGAFFQDDWRVLPNLTLNLGLRYDVQTAPTDTMNRTTNFRAGVQSVAIPSAPRGLLFPGDPGVPKTGSPTRYNHVSPRIGFAWDAFGNGKTIVHAGAGLFFGSIGGNEFELPSNSQPFSVRAQYSNVTSLTHPYSTDTTDFPGGISPYPYNYDPANPRFIKPTQILAMDADYRWPYNYQMNFAVEQQFTPTLAVSMAFVSALNRKLPLYDDANYPVFNTATPTANTTATANARRPVNVAIGGTPTYSQVYVVRSRQTSNYNGLQVSVDKRFSQHFSAKGYYSWSKTLASAYMNNNTLGNNFEDYNLPQLDRQRTDLDVRHTAVFNVLLKPDYYKGKNPFVRGAFNGWTISAIATISSGAPFNITTGSDNNGDGNTSDRPNVVAGKKVGILPNATAAKWFDTTAFCGYSASSPTTCPGTGPGGSDGTLRPYAIDAPGVRNINAAVFRDFPVYRQVKLQFRGEAINVFNFTNLGAPTGTLSSGNFGKITGVNSNFDNRQLQLGARILF